MQSIKDRIKTNLAVGAIILAISAIVYIIMNFNEIFCKIKLFLFGQL